MASSFLQNKAKKQAEKLEKKYGSSAYGGTTWLNEQISGKKKKKEDEDDIAPVRPVKQEEKDDGFDFFQKGAFADGYQFGDIAKTILGTAGDVGVGVVKGASKLAGGLVDAGTYGVAGLVDALGDDEQADKLRKKARKNVVDDFFAPVDEKLNKVSLLGKTTDSVMEGLGQVGGIILTGGLGAAGGLGAVGTTALTTGVMGASSMGSGMSEAYMQGATDEEAATYGLIKGVVDAGSEMIFGGLGKAVKAVGLSKGLSSLDDVFARKLASKITNHTAKSFVQYGVKASAEGAEEVLAGIGSAVGKKLTYMDEAELSALVADENLLEQFVVGAVTSGVAQSGLVPGMSKGSLKESVQTGRDFITGNSANEQKVIDREFENRVAEQETDGKKLTKREKSKLYDAVVRDMEKGYISTDTIEEVLGGETYRNYKDAIDSEEALSKEYEELGKLKDPTLAQRTRYQELHEQMKSRDDTARNELKSRLREEVMGLVQGDRLAESYNERTRRGQAFEADLTKYDSKQQAVIQRAAESGILNNTNRTHEFVDMIAKISADKGVLFDFTNNERLKESGFAVEDGVTVNGFVNENGVSLNIDSAKSLNSVVGHEITHVLEGTELYTALQSAITEYAKSKGDYQGRYDAISRLYKNREGADVDAELTADLVGDYLFTDSDFIHNLSTNHRNVFQKIYDEIKYLCKVATAGSKEARELEKVKRAFEQAYKGNGKAKGDTKYSLTENDKPYLDAVNRGDTETAQQMVASVARENGYTPVKRYHQTAGGFTEFSTANPRAGLHDSETPNGIFFKDNDHDIGLEGKTQLQMYLKADNMLHFRNREEANKWYCDNVEGYAPLQSEYNSALKPFLDELDEIEKKMFDPATTDDEYSSLDEREEAIIEEMRVVEDSYRERLRELLNGHFLNGTSGYDGIELDYDGHRWVNGKRENVHTYIVFDPAQAKSADPVTYDDSGNVIPLSERFNPEKTDIRYSLSDSEGKPIDSARISDNEFDTRYSLSHNPEIAKGQLDYVLNPDKKSYISEDELKEAQRVTNAMVDVMMKYSSILPEDKIGKVLTKNGSYDRSVENTTICVRTLAYNEFVDKVQEEIGRPLTQMESFLVSQKLYDIAVEPQCLYCYVSLDRKAFNDMLLRYMTDRDTVIAKYNNSDKSPATVEALYEEFLHGRKPTKEMRKRFDAWIGYVDNGTQLLSLADIATEDRQSVIKANGGNLAEQLKDARQYAQSASWSKIQKSYVAYRDEILKLGDRVVKNLNEHYGLRWYSFSDYSAAFIVENMQQITDASIRGLKGLSYTKDTDFAEIFAPSGMNINISVFVNQDKDGNFFIDEKQSANFEKALELRERYPNVGIVATVTNDDALRWAGEQEWSDVIIPFHIVRTGTDIAEYYKWINYTAESADTIKDKDIWNAYLDSLNLRSDNARKKVSKNIYPNEHKNDRATYLALCESRGLSPRFVRFAGESWYMKLVNETRLSADDSSPLKPIYDEDAAKRSFQKFVNKGGYEGGWYKDVINVDAEAKVVAQDVLAGKKANEVSYGRQDGFVPEALLAGRKANRTHGKFSLDGDNTRRTFGNYNVYGKDIAMQTEQEIAPVAVAENATTTEESSTVAENATVSETENIAPVYEQLSFDWRELARTGAEDESVEYWVGNNSIAERVVRGAAAEVVRDFDSGMTSEQLAQKSVAAIREYQQIQANKPYGESYTDSEQLMLRALYNQYTLYDSVAKDPEFVNELRYSLSADENSPDTLRDSDAPPEMDAPYYGDEETETTVDDPFENRYMDEVGSPKVKAYMYENPEVKPFFQQEAAIMLRELQESTKGEKLYNDQLYYDTNGEQGWMGQKRNTSEQIAYLLDGGWGGKGYTYAEIEKGLKAIIEDNGKENNACSKRIEFLINDRLRDGYTDFRDGSEIPPDEGYLALLNEKQITEYNRDVSEVLAQGETYAPPAAEDLGPVAAERVSAPRASEGIRPKRERQPGLIRVNEVGGTTSRNAKGQQTMNPPPKPSSPDGQQRMYPEKTARILTEEPKQSKNQRGLWSLFKEYVLDNGMVFEDLSLKTGNRELQAKWHYIRNAKAMAQSFMGKGKDGVRALNDVRQEVEKRGKTQAFSEYVYHLLNFDRMTLAQRYEGMENKPVFGNHVTAAQSAQTAARLEKANPEFKRWAQELYAINTQLREMLVEGGVLSRETADLWAEMYPHYIPIRRAGYEGAAINVALDTNRTGVNAPIKKATGGNRDILPMFDTMGQRTLQTYRAIAKNRFGLELRKTLGTTIMEERADLNSVMDSMDNEEGLLTKGKDGNAPTFTVFDGGKRYTFEITDEMYESMKPAGTLLNYTNPVASGASNAFRGVLTEYNPVFMASNAIKDAQDILINSQHPARTYTAIPRAIGEMRRGGHYYREYMENGGEENTYFDGMENSFDTKEKGVKKLLGVPPLSWISKANNVIERLPRMAEYIASREDGRSVEVSMLDAARVTTNFAAGGRLTKFANRNGATFLNASVQGAVQQARNIREAKANGLKGVLGLAAKVAVAGLPVMLVNHLLWDDDEEYEELSDYVKQNYYIVGKYGDGQFVRIPKGRTLAVIQDAFEQMKDLATGNDEADLGKFLELAFANLAPNNPVEDNIVAPIMQVKNNKTWYGEDLVPIRLQDLPAAEQFDESTDAISKWLGEKINVSPYKINYLLNQYSGGVGDVLLPYLTPEAERGENSLLAPLSDKFTTDSVMNNQNVSDFYDKKDELTVNANSSKATDDDVLKSKYMNAINSELSKLYAQKREIQNNIIPDGAEYDDIRELYKGKKIPDNVKYSLVRDTQNQIVELTRQALDSYENIERNGDYAKIGDMYFEWYTPESGESYWRKLSDAQTIKYLVTSAAGNANYATDGNVHYRRDGDGWTKISDRQLERQNEVTKALGITPEEYWSETDISFMPMSNGEYEYAYDNPETYALAKSVGGYDSYKTYSKELGAIHADKDENGKSISGSRKEKVLDYINNLDADFYTKIILWKNEYNSDDTYNYEIIEYLNGRDDISREEMESILKKLGFEVSANGDISW